MTSHQSTGESEAKLRLERALDYIPDRWAAWTKWLLSWLSARLPSVFHRPAARGVASTLQQNVSNTYSSLRIALAAVGLLFPASLLLVGLWWHDISWQSELSAYYWAGPSGHGPIRRLLADMHWDTVLTFLVQLDSPTPMRSWFVGMLFALGVLLFVYKGYSQLEDILLNVAGVSVILVALFPMDWGCAVNTVLVYAESVKVIDCHRAPFPAHVLFAIIFFVCIACVAVFCSWDTLRKDDESLSVDSRIRYKTWYFGIGVGMLLFPFIALAVARFLNDDARYVLWLELVGVSLFVAYWVVKSIELHNYERRPEIQHPERLSGGGSRA